MNSIVTFEEEPPSLLEMKARFEKVQAEKLPFLMVEEEGKGYGATLMKELMAQLKDFGIKTMVAIVASPQSVTFHEKFGFRKVGALEGWIKIRQLIGHNAFAV